MNLQFFYFPFTTYKRERQRPNAVLKTVKKRRKKGKPLKKSFNNQVVHPSIAKMQAHITLLKQQNVVALIIIECLVAFDYI